GHGEEEEVQPPLKKRGRKRKADTQLVPEDGGATGRPARARKTPKEAELERAQKLAATVRSGGKPSWDYVERSPVKAARGPTKSSAPAPVPATLQRPSRPITAPEHPIRSPARCLPLILAPPAHLGRRLTAPFPPQLHRSPLPPAMPIASRSFWLCQPTQRAAAPRDSCCFPPLLPAALQHWLLPIAPKRHFTHVPAVTPALFGAASAPTAPPHRAVPAASRRFPLPSTAHRAPPHRIDTLCSLLGISPTLLGA
ncbi:hypothetical protein B0H10DRAFT_2248372, partial [Mycena sp. CBHHK59/15]